MNKLHHFCYRKSLECLLLFVTAFIFSSRREPLSRGIARFAGADKTFNTYPTVYLRDGLLKSAYNPRVFETGNPFRESAEVTHTLPHRMCVPLLKWLASDYWQPEAL